MEFKGKRCCKQIFCTCLCIRPKPPFCARYTINRVFFLQENRWPLYSFESNDDYVYDVAWSPTHPALFATVDGTGRLDLWNLNNDTEVSTASVSVDGPAAAFNRVSWTQSGLHVTAGDDAGKSPY